MVGGSRRGWKRRDGYPNYHLPPITYHLSHGRQWQRGVPEQGVVEGAQVEARAQARCRVGAQSLDLALADFVGEGLARPDDVAVNLVDGLAFGETDVYTVAELPGNEAAAAVAMAVCAAGVGTVHTTVLLSPEEIDGAAKREVDYRSPRS